MRKVHFYLGPNVAISARQLTITRMMKSGDDSAPSAQYNADVGDVSSASVSLPNDQIWQAKLVDTLTSGEVSSPSVLNFHTGELQFPGPGTPGALSILSMEDLSSSSSSSSQSSSSSESSSSQSSSSSSA